MKSKLDLSPIKKISIIDIAKRLGIHVHGTKAMCFTGHDKASPSLSFLKSRNTWKCFGACGKYGDGITLVMEKEGLDFKSALIWFERNYGVKTLFDSKYRTHLSRMVKKTNIGNQQQVLLEEQEFTVDSELYDWLIDSCPLVSTSIGIEYLNKHGISTETANHFKIKELCDPKLVFRELVRKWGKLRVYKSGIAWGANRKPERLIWNSHAIIFPFYEQKSINYLQARMFDSKTKFLNLRGISKPMFNSDKLINLKPGKLVHICEGVPDAVSMESHGLAAVGILGATSFRTEWVDRFLKYSIVVLGDGDLAGIKFAKDISTFFTERGKSVQIKNLPEGKDVSDVLGQVMRAK